MACRRPRCRRRDDIGRADARRILLHKHIAHFTSPHTHPPPLHPSPITHSHHQTDSALHTTNNVNSNSSNHQYGPAPTDNHYQSQHQKRSDTTFHVIALNHTQPHQQPHTRRLGPPNYYTFLQPTYAATSVHTQPCNSRSHQSMLFPLKPDFPHHPRHRQGTAAIRRIAPVAPPGSSPAESTQR